MHARLAQQKGISNGMNIGIDVDAAIVGQTGIGHYTTNLIENLLKIDKISHYFLYAFFVRKREERAKIIFDIIEKTNAKNVTFRIFRLPYQWKESLIGTPYPYNKIIKDPLDLFFSPHSAGIANKGFPKTVVTIHDLAFMKFSEHRGKKITDYYLKRTKIAAQNSKKIIAVSEATKKDLIELLGVAPKKIKVIYEGANPDFKRIKNQRELINRSAKYVGAQTKYILSVGTLEPRKNLSVIVKAFSLLPLPLRQNYKLVFVGGQGWNNREFEKTILDYNLKEQIILTGFVPDEDLPYLYNRAELFIYPSLYEGFGLPLLEALSCGAPVIASNVSSLPEVAGKAAILVNPRNEKELAQKIKLVLTNPKLSSSLRKKGPIQAKKFSWQKAAAETLKLFKKAAE